MREASHEQRRSSTIALTQRPVFTANTQHRSQLVESVLPARVAQIISSPHSIASVGTDGRVTQREALPAKPNPTRSDAPPPG